MRKLFAVAGAALVLAPTALGHGPPGGGVGYVSSFSALDPQVVGVFIRVLGGDDRLQLVNYSGKTVVVMGYEGEPFLRFTPNGVYENLRSPATYQSRVRNPAQVDVPVSADPKAAPVWRKATAGSTFAWHDHRIHWLKPELPAVMQEHPDETHLIFRWRVPATADGKRFAISGFLGYRPPPHQPAESGTRWWVYAAAIGGALLVLVVAGAGVRRLRRRTPGVSPLR
jgi:hypothetical protein